MKRQTSTELWISAFFVAALTLAIAVLAAMGTGQRGISVALQLTGRLMFLPFWLAYTGGAIAALFGPAVGMLARRRRDFGLCFASALLVHIGLAIWLFHISAEQPISDLSFLLFSIGALFTCVLTIHSVERLRDALNPRLRQIVHTIAIEYLAFLFFVDFVVNPILNDVKHPIGYVPFAILIMLGPLLRLVACVRLFAPEKRNQYKLDLRNVIYSKTSDRR